MVVELVPGVVVLVGAVGQGRAGVMAQTFGHRPPGGGAIVALGIGHAVAHRFGLARLPQPGDQVQQRQMRLDVGAVDQPVILCTACESLLQLIADQSGAVGQHGDVAGRLQVVEGGVVIDAVRAAVPFGGQSRDTGIVVALAAADHPAVAVVGPDLDDVCRQVKAALPVEVHHLAVEVGAADGVRVALFDQIVLLADEAGDQRAPLGRGIVPGVVLPEGPVPLAAKADVPDHPHPLLCVDALLPQRPEPVGIFAVPGFQLRVNAGEHLSPQGLGVVVGQDQPHVRRGPAVAAGIFAGAGDDHIPPAAQQRLKCHDKGQVVPALHLPVGEQGLVVDEPPAVPDPGGAALLAEVLRHGDLFHGGKGLVVPEPEGQHPQKAAADLEQPVDEPQVVPGGKGQGFSLRLQAVALGGQALRLLQADAAAGGGALPEHLGHVPFQCVQRIPDGRRKVCRRDDLTVAV